MDDLTRWANDPLWDDEQSHLQYRLPLDLSPDVAATHANQLIYGIPSCELYMTAHYVCAKSPQTHRAAFKHAIDFLVLDGTSVVAASGGIIVEVQQHSNEWGSDLAYRDKLNYITIQTSRTEYIQYCHLAKDSVRNQGLGVGSVVREGQIVATLGKTGLTDRDHLHFVVFRLDRNPSPFCFKSLVPRWR